MIIRLNTIKDPNMLRVDKIIYIPNRNGIRYTVKRGDSLKGLAKMYSVKKENILSHNNIKNGKLIIGKKIFLPDARERRVAKKNYNHGIHRKKIVKRKLPKRRTFSWPMRGRITSTFGRRIDPFTKKRRFFTIKLINANN